ncbi:MAG TPA: recombinase zinc beta ribbon domain-containing protein [Acidimicrobiales bacterium]|nr:recombinase zinc beta ribbon domain-containing protein [Acidimicrobiales bacterium]
MTGSANKAYTGIVTWDGVEYPGLHEPLVSPEVFDKVAELLASRSVRGTRERRRHHYLKGLLYCGVCGRRLSIQHSKGTYTYFYCLGQKDRRYPTGCRESYVSADSLEASVEELYSTIQVPDSWADGLREAIAAEVSFRSAAAKSESKTLSSRRGKLEAERLKLMSAYYAEAIDIAVLRIEQDRIGRELSQIISRQESVDSNLADWRHVMDKALSLATNCARTYRCAGERSRKLLNASVLEKVNVVDGKVAEAEFRPPFDLLFSMPRFEYADVVGRGGFEPP